MRTKSVLVIIDRGHEDQLKQHVEHFGNKTVYELTSSSDFSFIPNGTILKTEDYFAFHHERCSSKMALSEKVTIVTQAMRSRDMKEIENALLFNSRAINADLLVFTHYIGDLKTQHRGCFDELIVYPDAVLKSAPDIQRSMLESLPDMKRFHRCVGECFPDGVEELFYLFNGCRIFGYLLHFDLKQRIVTAKRIDDLSKTVDFTPRTIRVQNLLDQVEKLIQQIRYELTRLSN